MGPCMSAMKARYEEFMFACKVVPEEPNTFTLRSQ